MFYLFVVALQAHAGQLQGSLSLQVGHNTSTVSGSTIQAPSPINGVISGITLLHTAQYIFSLIAFSFSVEHVLPFSWTMFEIDGRGHAHKSAPR